MRKTLFLAAAMSAVIMLTSIDAQAVPMAPAGQLAYKADKVIQVRGGCGYGRHRGRWGGCRGNG
jgi:hypothetical protein